MNKSDRNLEKIQYEPIKEKIITENLNIKNIKDGENAENTEEKIYHQKRLQSRNMQLVPPDGGWGWMVVLGCFITRVGATLPVIGFGILYSPLLMSFDVPSSKIAWIFNTFAMVWCVSTLFVGPLLEQFGLRKIVICGGILNSFSVILSAFAPSPDFLFFSFSILGGIAGSTSTTTTYIAISKYFSKRLGFAIGLTTLGTCFSSFVAPLIASFLLENYGYTGAALIYGALVLNQCVGGALFQPVEWHMKSVPVEPCPESDCNLNEASNQNSSSEDINLQMLQMKRQKCNRQTSIVSLHSGSSIEHLSMDLTHIYKLTASQEEDTEKDNLPRIKDSCSIFKTIIKSTYSNLKTLKFMRVVVISIANGCLSLGCANFQMWIPFVVTNAGYSLEMAAWCMSAASISNFVGRTVTLILADRKKFNIQYANLFGILLIGSSIIAFSIVKDIKYYIAFACLWSLGAGISLCLNSTIMISIMGVDLFPAVFGVASVTNGMFGIIFGPIVGAIRDATSSYMYALWLLGSSEMAAFCLWLSMPLAVNYDRRKEDKSKTQNL